MGETWAVRPREEAECPKKQCPTRLCLPYALGMKVTSTAALGGRSAIARCAVLVMTALLVCGNTVSHASDSSAEAHTVPVVDGAIGPCSVEFTVQDSGGAPVYNAKIRVHIAYRFLNAHKLDLEVATNIDGKGRFNGLPSKLKQPLNFQASQGDREGSASIDPAETCKAERTVVILKPDSSSAQH